MNLAKLQRFIPSFKNPIQKYSEKSARKAVQVCLLGADTPLGENLALLLKQNPALSFLHLYGEKDSRLAEDLEAIDTKCKVKYYLGKERLCKAIRTADIIVMLCTCHHLPIDAVVGERVIAEGPRAVELAKQCLTFAPKAIQLIHIPPVSVMTSIVAGVFKKSPWYHPGRIIGSTAPLQMELNSIAAQFNDVDPVTCHVPMIGGPERDTAVPLFSRARPRPIPEDSVQEVMAYFRRIRTAYFPKMWKNFYTTQYRPLSEACAINHLVTTIGMGILGDQKANASAFVRSNLTDTCNHVVSTVQFAKEGVVHNYGIPQLTDLEFEIFCKALVDIKKREEIAQDFLKFHYKEYRANIPDFRKRELEDQEYAEQEIIR